MTRDLFTPEQRATLLANGRQSAEGVDIDPFPVVRLFTLDANATWLLTELDLGEPDLAFGLCDLGLGFPEIGYVLLSELKALEGPSACRSRLTSPSSRTARCPPTPRPRMPRAAS